MLRHLLMLIAVAALAASVCRGADALPRRDYHLETVLVQGGQPQAVIVSSRAQPAYAEIARGLQDRVKALSGVELPIVDAAAVSTDDVLARSNAIVLGNLATSRFVETLYWEWYTITDLFYPGIGGHEVRTLHDPYGTGRNCILLGGSDDQGIRDAAEAFAKLLAGGEPLKVGRLMDIRLGKECPARPRSGFQDWLDPRLRIFRDVQGAPLGHTLASKIGLIYYYNGDEFAAERFRDLALNTDMISTANHYNAHLNVLVWDLIEESPVFSDEDRQKINEKFLTHVRGQDAAGKVDAFLNYPENVWLLDRHTSMMAICALTESRYFAKYYPADEWQRNLAAVTKYFNHQMTTAKGDSDLGGRGIYTYLECALIPALLLRDHRFIDSGALRQWGELCLMHCDNTGQMPQSGQSGFLSYPTFVLRACAALLHDGSFLATLPRREEAERIAESSVTPSSFMTGQAWEIGLQTEPMKKMVGVYALPLTQWEYDVRGKALPLAETFDKLTMRTGFERDDQYLLLDGLHGGPAGKPWPDVNAIVGFSQNGRILIDNSGAGESPTQHNVVTVSREGLGAEADRVAALSATANLPTLGYSHSRVRGYVFSSWDRHIFWRKGGWFVVLDRLAAKDAGAYSFECQWQTVGEPAWQGSDYASTVWEWAKENAPRDVLNIKNAEQLPLRYTQQLLGVEGGAVETDRWAAYCQRKGINRVRQVISRAMQAGEEQVFTNLLYVGGDRTKASYSLVKLAPTVALLAGDEQAYVGVAADGAFRRGMVSLQAGAFCVSPASLAVIGATAVRVGGISMQASAPCNLEFDLAGGRLTCEAQQALTLKVGQESHAVPAGVTSLSLAPPPAAEIAALKQQLAAEKALPVTGGTADVRVPAWTPAWTFEAGTEVLSTDAGDLDGDGQIETLVGLADGLVLCLDAQGKQRWTMKAEAGVRALAHATLSTGPAVLVGSDDENVYALSAAGGAVVWKHKCEVAPDNSGWTTQGKAKVQVIVPDDLDGDGKVELICGTGGMAVEALTESGERKWFTPIAYGVPDRIAVVKMPDGGRTLLVSCSTTSFQSMTRRLSAAGQLLEENAMYRQRGADMSPAPGLLVTDLAGDGKLEAIVGRGGAYAELALFDATTNDKPKWVQLLADNVTCLDTADVNGDGVAEIVAGSPSGWLTVFDVRGRPVWALALPHEVRAVSVTTKRLFVACADGNVYGVSFAGKIESKLALASTPAGPFRRTGERLVIGDGGGRVTAIESR